jgi:hypothetical protein
MKSATIWLPADAEPPVRVKGTITSGKRMLTIFWGIQGIVHYCWLPKDSTLDSPFFYEEVLSHSLRKSSQIPKNWQTLDFDSYGQYKGLPGKGNPKEIRCFPIQTHTTATV